MTSLDWELPDLELPDLDTDLPDLDLGPFVPLDLPDPDAMSLPDLAERYRPDGPLAAPGPGRRPPRWDDPQVLTMLGHLETGAYLTDAITSARLAERTVYRWFERGRIEADTDPDGLDVPSVYRHIWQAALRAQVVPEARALDTIHRAASRGAWRAAAWFLERRYPHRWGRNAYAWQAEREREREYVSVEELDEKLMRLIHEHRNGGSQ